jgi:hypothetical protein
MRRELPFPIEKKSIKFTGISPFATFSRKRYLSQKVNEARDILARL